MNKKTLISPFHRYSFGAFSGTDDERLNIITKDACLTHISSGSFQGIGRCELGTMDEDHVYMRHILLSNDLHMDVYSSSIYNCQTGKQPRYPSLGE